MTEQPQSISVVKSVSMKIQHVGMASDLQIRLGTSWSAVWCKALEEYYANHKPEPASDNGKDE